MNWSNLFEKAGKDISLSDEQKISDAIYTATQKESGIKHPDEDRETTIDLINHYEEFINEFTHEITELNNALANAPSFAEITHNPEKFIDMEGKMKEEIKNSINELQLERHELDLLINRLKEKLERLHKIIPDPERISEN